VSERDQQTQEDRPDRGAPRTGRRIATAIFWVFAVYIVAVGFWSITPQVFRPEVTDVPAARSCAEGIESLRAELVARASERLAWVGATDASSVRRWLDDWDRRHAALAARCRGPGAAPHAALARMRHRTESSLHRFDRELEPLDREIDRGLRSLTDH
jgi:hypothetical protein